VCEVVVLALTTTLLLGRPHKPHLMANTAGDKTKPQVIDLDSWLEDAKPALLPPVCNKLIYGGQLKVMVVGGPNGRSDYHIEAGEELFFQVKGDMLLKVVERGKHKDIPIREGQFFLLPPRIPHSPQRYENTVGLVIERERDEKNELDGMRWYVPGTTNILYEEFFHCFDLGVQLAPVIQRFRQSDMGKTGKPSLTGEGIVKDPPLEVDAATETDLPIAFECWIKEHQEQLNKGDGFVPMWEGADFEVAFVGANSNVGPTTLDKEVFYWQLRGSSILVSVSHGGEILLPNNSMIILEPGTSHSSRHGDGSLCMRLAWHTGRG